MSNFGVSALTTSALSAVKSLSTNRVWIKNSQTQMTLITVDVCISETHSIEAPPTKFPIENGKNITDDFLVEPPTLEISGMISDTPLNPVASLVTSALSTFLPPTGIIAGAAAFSLFSILQKANSPSIQAFQQFLGILTSKTPIDIFTTLTTYKQMWMSSFRVERSAQYGNCLMFRAHFVQVILVKPQLVTVAQYSNPSVSSALANLGGSQTSPITNRVALFNLGRITGGNAIGANLK